MLADMIPADSPSLIVSGDGDAPPSLWDGDALTLDMVTELDAEEVDEEARRFTSV